MLKLNLKKILLNFIIVLVIFFADRISKIYILKVAELENVVDIYINSYLNFYLIWNKGVAFGLFSFDQIFIYNSITSLIAVINVAIIAMIIKNEGFKKHSLLLVLGGSLGNLFDRIYYAAVPDFIDLHLNNFHWFVFNVADIFITIGIIFLILNELFFNNKKNEKNV